MCCPVWLLTVEFAVTLYTCIVEAPLSTLRRVTSCSQVFRSFPQYPQTSSGTLWCFHHLRSSHHLIRPIILVINKMTMLRLCQLSLLLPWSNSPLKLQPVPYRLCSNDKRRSFFSFFTSFCCALVFSASRLPAWFPPSGKPLNKIWNDK